jgi:hypothetical protein
MNINTVMVGAPELRAAIESGRKVFGADHDLMIARCPAWGSDDVCLIVRGKQHAAAARAVASKCGPSAKVTEQTSCAWTPPGSTVERPAYTYSVVEFPVAEMAS